MKKISKFFGGLIITVILLILLYINCGLYYQPGFEKFKNSKINIDLISELRFLKTSILSGADEDMQKIYPEGYVFMNALYGLSWCSLANSLEQSSDLYKEAHVEIQTAYEKIESENGKRTFSEYLPLPYGAFYNGWTNYLLGKKLSIENPNSRNLEETNTFKNRCAQIASVIRQQSSPYIESYPQGAWPADGVICVASLALHDKLFQPMYQNIIHQWMKKVKANLDSFGLIPHAVHAYSGEKEESARGSSQSLMLIFLLDIDPEFGHQQFNIFKKLFLDYRLGLPGVREYPKENFGVGDIDSGPVIFQIGAAASMVGLHTMALYGESSIAIGLRNSIESFGMPTWEHGKKKYLFGQLPMADAFIAWSHSAVDKIEKVNDLDFSWRNHFHLYSILLLIPLVVLLILIFRKWS